jgi:putative Mn2+ efflux pump MntP
VKAAPHRTALTVGLSFGLAQGIAPLLGFAAGILFSAAVAAFDHWIAFGILSFLGAKLLREGLTEGPEDKPPASPALGWALFGLAVATSIDAVAAGVTFDAMGLAPLGTAAIIGFTTMVVCVPAVYLGQRLGTALGGKAEVIGGLALIGLGIKTLLDHHAFG